MRINTIIFWIMFLGMVSFVAAIPTFSLNCPASVQPNANLVCTLDYTDLDPNKFGGLDFTISPGTFTVNGNPTTDYGMLMYNIATLQASLAYDFAGDITASGTMATINLIAGSTTDKNIISLINIKYYDENSGVASGDPVLDIVEVQSVSICTGTPPTNADICSDDRLNLVANTAYSLVDRCTAAIKCEYTCDTGYHLSEGACVADDSCTSVSATECSTGVSCPGNVPIPATGCSEGEVCQDNACVIVDDGAGGGDGTTCDLECTSPDVCYKSECISPGKADYLTEMESFYDTAEGTAEADPQGWTLSLFSQIANYLKGLFG